MAFLHLRVSQGSLVHLGSLDLLGLLVPQELLEHREQRVKGYKLSSHLSDPGLVWRKSVDPHQNLADECLDL